jgi:hypothetical protein
MAIDADMDRGGAHPRAACLVVRIHRDPSIVVFGAPLNRFADNGAYLYLALSRSSNTLCCVWISGSRELVERLRREDLASHPAEVSATIARSLGETWAAAPLGDTRVVSLRRSHTASGNPSRFQTGDIRIVSDDEWQAKMRSNDRLLVTALTAPVLLRYGYPLATPTRHDRVVPL